MKMMFFDNLIKIALACLLVLGVDECAWSLCYGNSDHPIYPSIQEEYKLSKFVFVGVVLQDKKISSFDDPEGYVATLYTIKVLKMFKGRRSLKIVIRSENTSSRFQMDVKREYVIFAQNNNNGLFLDNCGNSGLLENSKNIIAKVKELSYKK